VKEQEERISPRRTDGFFETLSWLARYVVANRLQGAGPHPTLVTTYADSGAQMNIMFFRKVARIAFLFLFALPCYAQLPRLGVGAKVSTLGFGFEAATAVTSRSNVRGGFNFFGYDHDASKNGIDYAARLRFRSIEAHYDWFLGGFHVG